MTADADIVVAGAGHNSLIAACYLAKAGYRCLVLDARDVPGGGATTEELLLPGYKVDSCATGHTLIRVNPLLTRDELGLIRDYGLRYVDPDPVAHVAFPDGEQLTMWLDKDRTAAETPAPVDVIGREQLENAGVVEVGQALQMLEPSFNFSRTFVCMR